MHIQPVSIQASGLAVHAELQSEQSAAPCLDLDVPVSRPAWHDPEVPHHSIHVYDEDTHLLDTISHFIAPGLAAGEAAVVIATPCHRDQLDVYLRTQGVDVTTARARGQYVFLDAAETLAQFMVDGSPHAQRFVEVVGGVIAHAGSRYRRVRAFGEMVALLWAEGNPDAALLLEALWNNLATVHPFSLLCAYPLRDFARADHAQHLVTICAAHSHVVPAEGYTALASADERLRTIVQLQQKARALETEITERQALEQALWRSQHELTDFFDHAPVGLHWVGPDGLIQRVNEAELRMLGYSRDDYLGHHIAEFHADQHVIADILQRLQAGEELHGYEARMVCKDGTIKHVLIDSNVLWEQDQFIHTRCFTRDITVRKQAETAQQFLIEVSALLATSLDPPTQLEQLARLLVPTLADWCCIDILQDDGHIHRLAVVHADPTRATLAEQLRRQYPVLPMDASHTLARVLRTGQSWFDPAPSEARLRAEARDAVHWDLVQALGFQAEIVVPILARGRVLGTLTCVRSEGTRRYSAADLALAEDLGRRAALALDNARLYQEALAAQAALQQAHAVLEQRVAQRTADLEREMAERQQAEAQLRQQQTVLFQHEKLAAMGTLLASVAHELNNPLAIVMMQADLLQEERHNTGLAEPVQAITQAAERAMRIVRNFLTLARQHPPERQAVGLNTVLRGALELLVYGLQVDSVTLHWQLAPDLPTLWADPHQLHQVIVNLVTNAHQALREVPLPRGLTLTTRYDPQQACVLLEVADTGPGIPPVIQAQIFEPFFTTKPAGVGTGLGLPLCRGIIEEHGGSIRVESQPGQGTVFQVTLPVLVAGQSNGASDLLTAPHIGATDAHTILVVDDEPAIARALAQVLRRQGHTVDTAANGRLALAKLATQAYDLLLCDLRMPDLDGPGLYHALQQQHPHLLSRMIFLTGDTLSADARTFLDQTGAPRLSKPCRAAEVRQLVAQVLQDSAA